MATRPKPGNRAAQPRRTTPISKEVRRFIVEAFACYKEVTEVRAEVLETFGLDLAQSTVYHYHPEHSTQCALRWRVHFDATRKAFVTTAAQHAIAHLPFRLQELLYWYRFAKKAKNPVLAASILRQAAEDVGGMYRRLEKEAPGEQGSGDLEAFTAALSTMEPEEAAKRSAELLSSRLKGDVLPFAKRKTA